MKKKHKTLKRALKIAAIDLTCFLLICFGVCIIVFHLFRGDEDLIEAEGPAPTAHVRVTETPRPVVTPEPAIAPEPVSTPESVVQTVSASTGEALTLEPIFTPEPVLTPTPTETPTPAPIVIPGLLGNKFADKFLPEGASPEETKESYRSSNVVIELRHIKGGFCTNCNRVSENESVCSYCGKNIKKANKQVIHIADVYIRDISSLQSAYITKTSETCRTQKLAKANNGILAVNSDYYINAKINKHGWIVRNAQELARFKDIDGDLCVLYDNGVMETVDVTSEKYDIDEMWNNYPTQVWYFGPALLTKDGQAKTITGKVSKINPRTVIGYYEPGHYLFMMVEGSRSGGDCRGLTLTELSAYCAELHLTAAYNLDGGDSSVLYFNGTNYGHNGRDVSDIIYIAEPIQ